MSTERPTGAAILRTLMELDTDWKAGHLPLRTFCEIRTDLPQGDPDTSVTGIILGARYAFAFLGPYVEDLLATLLEAAQGHPRIRSGATLPGTRLSDDSIGPTDAGDSCWPLEFGGGFDRGAVDRLNKMLQPFEWRQSAQKHRPSRPDQLLIPSPGHYAALQQAFALNRFQRVGGSPFPRAVLDKGGTKGFAELRPHSPGEDLVLAPEEIDAIAQRMWTQREEMSDKDADTMDAISTSWIQAARSSSDRVPVYIDDLLRQRGLQQKKGGQGRRGGFAPKQRRDLWACLLRLQDIWIDLAEVTLVEEDRLKRRRRKTRALQSRAFVMTDRVGQRRIDGTMDVEAILVTPGEAFGRFLLGPGRQLALLSSKALRYDPKRQHLEKRLARYLAWQWRAGARQGNFVRTYRVRTLGQEIGIELDSPRHPTRSRDRLESALDRLQHDGIIAAWQYLPPWNEDALPRQRWLPVWLEARIAIEAPDIIKNAYRKLDQGPKQPAGLPKSDSLAGRLRQTRSGRGISQLALAEELGISQGYVAQLERGREPSRNLRRKLEHWIQNG
ncbi:MAG: helix-turn-helix transcriptional regulator [bacterium]|nr:helix-turn-helix transcriptional regulator [bacterium]